MNDFTYIFFAFNDEQFKEGMEKIGLKESDTKSICSIGYSGYVLKSKSDDFTNMNKNHKKELQSNLKDKEFLFNALLYELNNHEFVYSNDTTDALEVLGFKNESEIDTDILNRATKEAMQMDY